MECRNSSLSHLMIHISKIHLACQNILLAKTGSKCTARLPNILFNQTFTSFSCARQNVAEKMEIMVGELPMTYSLILFPALFISILWSLPPSLSWIFDKNSIIKDIIYYMLLYTAQTPQPGGIWCDIEGYVIWRDTMLNSSFIVIGYLPITPCLQLFFVFSLQLA